MKVWGIIKYSLDDFSALDVHWVPDTDSLRLFNRRCDRDAVLAELEDTCETYEQYLPLDLPVITGVEYEEMKIRKRYESNTGQSR